VWEPVKFAPAPGTKLTYKSTSTTGFEGMGQTFTTKVAQTSTLESEALVEGWTRVKSTVVEHKVDSDMPFGETPDPTGLSTSVLVSSGRKQKDFKVVANGKLTTQQVDVLMASAKTEVESGFEGLVLPEGDLKVGQTWSHEHAPSGAGLAGMPTTTKGKLKTTYTVVESGANGIVIEAKTAGTYDLTIETPEGAFTMGCKTDETRKYTVRGADGIIAKAETTSSTTMTSDFGEFSTKTTSVTELQK
jgi:hypothetical protein